MGTTADKLNHLINTKEGIRQEINRAYNTEEISTSDTFNSYIQKLEEHPFYIDTFIEKTIKNIRITNITSIGNSAFNNCTGLTSISFPNVTSVASNAFYSCSKLTSVDIPNTTSIGDSAFNSCNSLTSVSFPNVTSIGDSAFNNCTGLTSISFPEATSIGFSAFRLCSNLTSVSFPNTINIAGGAFDSCSNLTSVDIPNTTSIGNSAFNNCTGLTSISFPEATSIGSSAFSSCSKLTAIYIGTNTSTVCTLSSTNAFNSCTKLTNIYVPYSLVDSYKSATNWSFYANKIKADAEPVECIALSITADDVTGNKTSTTVYYTAECTYTKEGVLQSGTKVFTGKATSSSFAQNTSTTDTVQRTISFTFFGKTATTTITQGVWINQFISVTTSGISKYGWIAADSKYNIDGYDVYMSNTNHKEVLAVMKLECVGYTDLTIYIRSDSMDEYYDYTIASNANASTYPTSFNSSDTKAHTRGNSNPSTALSGYTAVNYTGLSGNSDIIYIVHVRDLVPAGTGSFVLIPKQS